MKIVLKKTALFMSIKLIKRLDMEIGIDCPCMGKNLDKHLQPAILLALCKESLHGFALLNKIGNNPICRGDNPDATGLYRYLNRMEKSELLTSAWEFDENGKNHKKVYSITEKGKRCLDSWSDVLKDYASSIEILVSEIDKEIK